MKKILIEELEEQFEYENIDKNSITNKVINVYEEKEAIEVELTYEVKENIGIEEIKNE